MYLEETYTDPRTMKSPFFSVEFSDEEVAHATRLEWWASSFDDPGPDFNEYRLVDDDGKIIAKRIVQGY